MFYNFKNKIIILLILIASVNFSCTNFRQAIGSKKIKLDEFSIVEANRLEMPPKFDLKSEMDVTLKTGSKAKDEISLLFGVERRLEIDEIDSDLAQFFQFNSILPNIREIIDQETYDLQINSRAGIGVLFGLDKQPKIGPLLDPEKEKERIKKLQ